MNPSYILDSALERFPSTEPQTSICSRCGIALTGTTCVPPSPISHLIGSNAIPTQEQGRWIQSAIDGALVDMKKLKEEIWRVKSVLKQLEAECQVLEEFVVTHQAFLTLARRVYPEIWVEIFKHCPRGSQHHRFPEVEDSFDANEGPLVLTQVCSAWRQIAISTPQLWTTIRLTYRGHSSSQKALVRTWIQRSRGLPLRIAVVEAKPAGYPKIYPPLDWSQNEALHELCMSSGNWKYLYLSLPASPLPWAAFDTVRHQLHSLQHLTVYTSRGYVSREMRVEIFDVAPRLHSISMDYSCSFSTIDVPLTQITRLEFDLHKHTPAYIDTCLSSLNLVPNVQECVFHMGTCEPWTTLPTVHHSQLRSLTIIAEPLRDNAQGGLSPFFGNISVPNLKSLVVYSITNGRQWDHYSFGHFLSRTPSLEALELKCDNIQTNDLLEELREATSLSSLTLCVPTRPTEELLDYLGSTDTVNLLPFLVQLQSISFEGLAKPEFVYRIGQMITCRTMLANSNRTANFMFVKYDFSSSAAPNFDCPEHVADSFTVTRHSASFIFRRRSNETSQLPFPILA